METKVCSMCNAEKCTSKFHNNSNRSDGKDNRCKECKRRSYKYTDEIYIKNKRNNLRSKFNLSLEEYNKMFNNQEGCCAICGTHQSKLSRSLAVDHSHTNGHIRGLLCQVCNTALGKFKDSIEMLDKAAQYLKRYGE